MKSGNKIKLMQITHDMAIGGLQQVVLNICRTINRDIFDVSVLCLREIGKFGEDVEKLGIKVFSIPQPKHGADYLAFLKIAKILKSEKIDIIHTHNTQPFTDGTVAALLSGVKTIIHTDHARSFPDKWRYMFAERIMSLFAYKVVGCSEHTSENLIKYEKISPKKIVTIPNGIYEKVYAVKIDKAQMKMNLGIPKDGFVLGVAVRLAEQKGLTYLIKAMPRIIKEFPTISLLIAGDGPLKDDLEKEAKDLKLGQNVKFLGPRYDIPELLNLFDLYVMPSLWEGLPMIILEAFAAQCPVLSTDVGGVSTAIENNVNGVLVKAGSVEQLEKTIIETLKNPKVLKNYSDKSIIKFREYFSAELMTSKYEELYLRRR